MRFSDAVTEGRVAELGYPEMFTGNEEVIVFGREEFSRAYLSIMERIDQIVKIDLHLDRG